MKNNRGLLIFVLFLLIVSFVSGECLPSDLCTDTEDCNKNLYFKGYVEVDDGTGKIQPYEDTCNGADLGYSVNEWSCDGDNPKLDILSCPNEDEACVDGDGICKKVDCKETDGGRYDFGKKGVVTEIKEGNEPKILEDTCNTEGTLNEWYCYKKKAELDIVPCPSGTECVPGAGRCAAVDTDADGIPDLDDNCIDTSLGDLVDLREGTNSFGCSCEQGAELVMQVDDLQGHVIECSKIKDLSSYFPWNHCPDDTPGHCCDSIKNVNEFSVDCGGSCSSCESICTIIQDGGDLDILFVPIGYISSKEDFPNNFHAWVDRAAKEAEEIVSTPPFNEGHVKVTRLDQFLINSEIERKIMNDDLIEFSILNLITKTLKLDEFRNLCPSVDEIIFMVQSSGPISVKERLLEGRSGKNFHFIVRYNSPFAAILHEFGHSFCGLDDEVDYGIGIAETYIRNPLKERDSINCDFSPEICTINENNEFECQKYFGGEIAEEEELICKWHPDHSNHENYKSLWLSHSGDFPDAGCVKGCMGGKLAYRSENDFLFSMMNYEEEFVVPEPGLNGKGTWNQIGYEKCKELVEQYEKG